MSAGNPKFRCMFRFFPVGSGPQRGPNLRAANDSEPLTAGASSVGGRRPQAAPAGSVVSRASQRDGGRSSPQRTAPAVSVTFRTGTVERSAEQSRKSGPSQTERR